MKKIHGDIFILLMCTINDNHMYGPWNMDRNRHSFFVIFGQISPFTPLTTWKIKIWKKKHTKRHHHFTLVYHKWQSYDLCFLRYGVRMTELFVNLGHFLPAYPSKSHKNENVQKLKTKKTKKTKKKHVEISFY